jgi:AraC-like DNA-binding protein
LYSKNISKILYDSAFWGINAHDFQVVGELYSTIGREIHAGYEMKLYCLKGVEALSNNRLNDRFRCIYVKTGFGILKNREISQLVTAPSIICLNEKDSAEIIEATGLTLDILYFDPTCFGPELTFDNLNAHTDSYNDDFWFFRPFMIRRESYVGASKTNQYSGNRISELISLAGQELTDQRDGLWPCRSRSFFIELLLLVNRIYNDDEGNECVFVGKMDDEIREIVNYIHIHYPEKTTMDTITKTFHTNKTTINQKFKSVMGFTVIQYLNNLRMQIACSFLRKTELTVGEIMERVGFKDDAHFLRMFKKYAHCTPSVYRTRSMRL